MDDKIPQDRVAIDEVEALLTQLPGITAVRIMANDWGAIEEIHVLSTTDRNPKQVVRDIESSLLARWGMNVDHKKISVAQLTGSRRPESEVLTIEQICLRTDLSRNSAEVSVRVAMGGESFPGDCAVTGLGGHDQSLRLAATATAAAVTGLMDPACGLAVNDTQMLELAGRQVAVVVTTIVVSDGEEWQSAAAELVCDDPLEAVATAVLRSVSRLSPLIRFRSPPAEKPAAI